jgi:tetratricopeptide (TPR) repeat protein
MPFICLNNTCAIAISKAAFPVVMNCPVCQQMLTEQVKTSPILPEDQALIDKLPYVIAYPLRQTLLEQHPWTRINLFKDTFLNYLKYLGLLSASEFFNSPIKDRGMVALFHQNLAETAFGKWNHYIREALKYLKEQNHPFFCPDLPAYYEQVESGKKVKQYKGEIEFIDANGDSQLKKQEATAIGMLINFRNRYLGHGLTLDADSSTKLWDEYFPIFRSLLEQMNFTKDYPMYKREHGEDYLLQTADIQSVESIQHNDFNIWIQNNSGEALNILPFFIVPGEVALTKESKEQIFAYESYTGKTIKFFSPEGTEKQTSGKILEKLNLLLRDKQKEIPFIPENFTKEVFLKRIEEENKILLDTLISEKKIIPGVYQHREQMEIKLREWIGARANIFFIAAEAGSGKTNLLAEMQKQYTERGYPTLMIRAGRMEKLGLKEQVAYLLNIDDATGLDKYISIAGTQAEPTFILIDGLNEAHNAESIWQELIDWSKIIEPGSIKFVVTSRANTKADVERYNIEEADLSFLYGDNKDHEKGLGAYAFWLTPLDMNEMKGAWENYVAKDKSRYKPQFSFDDIATFDRAIYNQINNPLVLRLFLEIYNGKSLPKKGGKHLHIWQDWFNTFSEEEQRFLKLLTDEVWLKGENELLLDDLLKNENLKPYLTSDLVNAPYARMKNMGWLSRYVKDMNGCVAFTVEGALLYLLGLKLQQQEPVIDLTYIQTTLSNGTKLQQSAIESFLCEQALAGDLDLVTELIDAGTELMDVCIRPLLYYLKTYGVEATINKILEDPTENDWKVFLKINKTLDDLQEQVLRKQLLAELMPLNTLNIKPAIELGLKTCFVMDMEQAQEYISKIDNHSSLFSDDTSVLEAYGDVLRKFAQYDKALDLYKKCLHIRLQTLDPEHPDVATSYNNIGLVWEKRGEYDKTLEYYKKCLDICLKTLGAEHPDVAASYNNIGQVWYDKGVYDEALVFYQKCLDIELKTLGAEHPYLGTSYNNIGQARVNKGDYDEALVFYQKCLDIELKTLGAEHPDVATSFNNIGIVWYYKGEYDKALEFYHKCLNIRLKSLGAEHPDVASSYNNIGVVWKNRGEYDKALEYYKKSLDIELTTHGAEHPDVAVSYNNIGLVWEHKGEYDKAIDFYHKCLDIWLKSLGTEHPDVATIYNNIGSVWHNKGVYDKALEFYQKSLDIELKTLGVEHPDVAMSYNNIGDVWLQIHDLKKAKECYRNCLNIRSKVLGPNHPLTIEVQNKISAINI